MRVKECSHVLSKAEGESSHVGSRNAATFSCNSQMNEVFIHFQLLKHYEESSCFRRQLPYFSISRALSLELDLGRFSSFAGSALASFVSKFNIRRLRLVLMYILVIPTSKQRLPGAQHAHCLLHVSRSRMRFLESNVKEESR